MSNLIILNLTLRWTLGREGADKHNSRACTC